MNAEQLREWVEENAETLFERGSCGESGDSVEAIRISVIRELFDGKVLVPVEYVEKVERTIYRMADSAVAKLTEIAPNQGWDAGEVTAEMELRPLRAMLAASQEPQGLPPILRDIAENSVPLGAEFEAAIANGHDDHVVDAIKYSTGFMQGGKRVDPKGACLQAERVRELERLLNDSCCHSHGEAFSEHCGWCVDTRKVLSATAREAGE